MAKEKDPNEALSDESIAHLEAVKKGKSRKFAMLCKGPNVVSLVVFKKGNYEQKKKEAKESGTGQFYYGVIVGRSQDLTFQLARSEGFDKEPVKPLVLKTYLEDAAKLKCKPTFEIVEAIGAVLDQDDPLTKKFLALRERARSVTVADPQQAQALDTLVKNIERQLDEDETEEATKRIADLEKLLTKLEADAAGTDDVARSVAEKLSATLQKLVGQAKSFLTTNGDAKSKLLEMVADIKNDIEAKRLDEAKRGLIELGNLLKSGPKQGDDKAAGGKSPEMPDLPPVVIPSVTLGIR